MEIIYENDRGCIEVWQGSKLLIGDTLLRRAVQENIRRFHIITVYPYSLRQSLHDVSGLFVNLVVNIHK